MGIEEDSAIVDGQRRIAGRRASVTRGPIVRRSNSADVVSWHSVSGKGFLRGADATSPFKTQHVNALAPSFSQWSNNSPASLAALDGSQHTLTATEESPPRHSSSDLQSSLDQLHTKLSTRSVNVTGTLTRRTPSRPQKTEQAEDLVEAATSLFASCATTHSSSHELISSLELKSLLGVGSMGTVYTASIMGQEVVCKIIEHDSGVMLSRVKDRKGRAELEGYIGRLLSHPNVVTGYVTFSGCFPHSKLCVPSSDIAASSPGLQEREVTILLQEFCAGGTLRAALASGALYEKTREAEGEGDDPAATSEGATLRHFKTLAQVAVQIAFGLSHIHSCNVAHCDLNASNVFLQPVAHQCHTEGSLGFSIKIGDLGVACVLPQSSDGQNSAITGAMHGTVSHMPSEALEEPHSVSTKTDIWSFGMLLWELWTLEVPFDGQSPHVVVKNILARDLPRWPAKTPPVLIQIAQHCWSVDPMERPDALTLASTFAKLAAVLRDADAHNREPPPAALGADSLGKPRTHHHLPMQDEELEDALLNDTIDVQRLQLQHLPSVSAGSRETTDMIATMASLPKPPEDDGVALLLWELLQVPDPAKCLEVKVTPFRTLTVLPLPYLNNHKYMEDPMRL